MTYREISPPERQPRGRVNLARVLGRAGDVIGIEDVIAALSLSRSDAAKRLSRWAEQGWLRRVRRGAYLLVPIDSLESDRVLADPWVLVPALFAPCYIAGRTAAEHWDLTEQIFNDIVVITGKPIRERRQVRHGTVFTLKHLREDLIFGTKPAWRQRTSVPISDIHRTILDMLDDPSVGGGIQHVSECLSAYLARIDRDDQRLIQYADRLGNGAVFKRLGFLANRHEKGGGLADICGSKLTTGNAKLDPAVECPRLVTKWHLRVPESWDRRATK